ncbi:unnamed protein product [Ceutorhynchus assimilis]|uniref:Uncharacterized protein n=1 Tax=Ceutorhynchus assimilis TaxID=467358 RepID=A0A9N9QL59_9CUCU|nr:unnamed protein product [Ceutorhynchus assimilis]
MDGTVVKWREKEWDFMVGILSIPIHYITMWIKILQFQERLTYSNSFLDMKKPPDQPDLITIDLIIHKNLYIQGRFELEVLVVALAAEYDYSDEYSYGDERPAADYTKYFNQVGAASGVVANKQEKPQESFGFIPPAEFESFFNTPLTHFGAEAKASNAPQAFLPQPKKLTPFDAFRQTAAVEPKDYFEESQKNQESVKPGPHYVSHQVPAPENYDAEERAQSKDDVETIPPPLNKKHKKVKPVTPSYDTYDDLDVITKTNEQVNEPKINPLAYYGTKSANYETGKSSSTVSQYPAAAGYLSSLKIPTTTVTTPYQKYSYQPINYEALQSKYLEALVSTPSTNIDDNGAAHSENAPENLKNKDCRKIHSPENAENMNCFVCEDAPNKSKYTQCSYKSSEEPVNEFAGSSIRYSSPVKAPIGFRHKRSPRKGKYSDDPYFQVSQRNRKYFEDYDKEQQAAESERQKDFHYKPYQPEEYESYSESQSSEILKQPGACKKVDRKGMTCTVCKDPKTGGNFEQCSYTSAPKENKYAYVAEKKYDSEDDEPEETKTVTKQSSEEASTAKPDELEVAASTVEETEVENDEEEKEESDDDDESEAPAFNYQELKKEKALINDDPYNVPEHFAESVSNKKTTEDNNNNEENFDEYHYKLFPELNNKEEADEEEEQKTDATEQKQQDVEEVLAEFAKKDRSNCKKAVKNGMTCFLCVDKNKVQHEECMYIAESKPKPTHIAYHEVQRLKDPKNNNPEEETEESKKVEAAVTPKRKKFFKKVATSELNPAASNKYQTIVPFDLKASASAPDAERLEDAPQKEASEQTETETPTPPEVEVGDEEGAYSHETKPTYSKLFGTTLPKYMVEKTEFEKDFDEVSGF